MLHIKHVRKVDGNGESAKKREVLAKKLINALTEIKEPLPQYHKWTITELQNRIAEDDL